MSTTMTRLLTSLFLCATALAILVVPPQAHAFADGFYVSLGVGGAVVSGDRGIALENNCTTNAPANQRFLWQEAEGGGVLCVYTGQGDDELDEVARTDFGSGMSFHLRFGYTIEGYVSPEAVLFGHGDPSSLEGAAAAMFQLRYHPVQHAIPHEDRAWDVDLFFGVGYGIAGYRPDETFASSDDGKGWDGLALSFGTAFNYMVTDTVSVGLDLRFLLPQYDDWIVNFDKNFRSTPVETPSTLVFAPVVQVNFHP